MLKKAQIALVSLTAAFICILLGFFMGRSTLERKYIRPENQVTITQASGKLDINSATVNQLQMLPGIGPVLAQSIIQYRQNNGSFASVDELLSVPGIGEKRLNEIIDYITVGG
jgi:comEA protein